MIKTCFVILTFLTTQVFSVFSQNVLDNSFGTGGKVNLSVGLYDDNAYGAALQADGKIVVVAGTYDDSYQYNQTVVTRFLPDGTPDPSFNNTGYTVQSLFPNAHEYAFNPAIQQDGKIVVSIAKPANYNGHMVLRLNADGSPDTTFGSYGLAVNENNRNAYSAYVAMQTDGKVVVGGHCLNEFPANGNGFYLARFNSDGSVDSTFNGTGFIVNDLGSSSNTGAKKVVIDNSGNIYLTGYSDQGGVTSATVWSVTSSGNANNSFDSDGLWHHAYNGVFTTGTGMAIDANGKLIVSGTTFHGSGEDYRNLVMRLNTDGSFDNTFGGTGKVEFKLDSTNTVGDVTVDAAGKIVITGAWGSTLLTRNTGVARLNSDGSFDNTFNGTGHWVSSWGYSGGSNALLVQSDGKLVTSGYVAGITNQYNEIALIRLHPTGGNPSAINTISSTYDGLAHPNPFSSILKIAQEKLTFVQIADLTGRLIYTSSTGTTAVSEIDTSEWPSGVYISSFVTPSGIYQQKLVKQ